MRFRLLGILGWLLALLLAGVTCLLAWQLDRRLGIESELRADPGGLSIHRGLETTSSPSLMILGDSRASALGQPRFPGWSVLNLGVAGQTTTEILSRAGRDLVLHRPDALVLIAGVNDLKSGPGGPAVSGAAEAIDDILKITSSLEIPVLVMDTWPHASIDLRSILLPDDLPDRCLALTRENRNRPEAPNVRFAEVTGLIGDDGLVRTRFARDGLHLNDEGNRLVLKAIGAFLENDSKVGS